MRRAFHIIASILELALLVGAYELSTLAKAKLGLNRWLVYHNQRWEDALPLHAIELAVAVVLVAFLCWTLVRLVRNPHRRQLATWWAVLAGVLTVVWFYYTLGFSAEDAHAYYLVSLMLALAALLQNLQALALSGSRKRADVPDGGGAPAA